MTLNVLVWIHRAVALVFALKLLGSVVYALRKWDYARSAAQDALSSAETSLVILIVVSISGYLLTQRLKEKQCVVEDGSPQ